MSTTPETRNPEEAILYGQRLEDEGDFEAALRYYRKAVDVAPTYARAHLNVGNALRKLHEYQAAAEAYGQAIISAPEYAYAHFNLGTLLAELGQWEAAEHALQRSLSLQPDLAEKVVDAESYLLFSSAFREPLDPIRVSRDHFRVGQSIARLAGHAFDTWSNSRRPDRRLRVGYVSADFGGHPVSLFLRVVLERHDRIQYATFCYSNNARDVPVPVDICASVDCVRDIGPLTDAQAAALIRSDEIDVLVDLSGHTQNNRLGVFAMHPAPVQVTWLGYLNTTGLGAMDYRICDRFTDPPGATEALHSEHLYRMPHSQWCYRPWERVPLAKRQPSPDAIVFGSCNQHLKVSDYALRLWSQILMRLPNARLVMLDMRDEHARATMRARLEHHGIPTTRFTLRGRESTHDYYRTIGAFDIALDTFPHNGATTTLDTLWMGVPIVGLRGERGISRASYSILMSLGVPELIAESDSAYVECNVRLAKDVNWRTELHATLRDRLEASPLMDASQFTRDLEAAYRTMWRNWCAGARGQFQAIEI